MVLPNQVMLVLRYIANLQIYNYLSFPCMPDLDLIQNKSIPVRAAWMSEPAKISSSGFAGVA